jgi:SAM-dependent methyltransferase
MDPKDIVRRGYDALSYRYRGDSGEPAQYATWLAQLRERVPAGGAILDLGCGCGVPLARDLAASGYEVIGVDLSAVQVERARHLVPTASFLHADATQVSFPPSAFDAVVSLYALIPFAPRRAAGAARPDRPLAPTKRVVPGHDRLPHLDRTGRPDGRRPLDLGGPQLPGPWTA